MVDSQFIKNNRMKKLVNCLVLISLFLITGCGSSATLPEPVNYFKLEVEGEQWEMGKRRAYLDLIGLTGNHFGLESASGGRGKWIALVIDEESPILGMYTSDRGDESLTDAIVLSGVSGNESIDYSTRYCKQVSYSINVTELGERARGTFECKVCTQDGSDSVQVTNGEFYVEMDD